MPLTTGARLGPYEIVGALGAGGMGEVYRATDTRLGRTVALKVLPEALAADPERRQRLEREARIAGNLNHPHICTLYDIGEERSQPGSEIKTRYLVMEYLEGTTLESRLAKGRLPIDQALIFAMQTADALDKAHRRGVVHRDLKPANVMLTGSGVKLLDFGLATQRHVAWGSTSQIPTIDGHERITTEGAIVGTLQYMAPEQLEGGQTDARTDIFAFGALLYEMVTGARAFESGSQAGLIGAILRADPRPIGELVAGTPPLLSQTISRCLSKDPDERWQTVSDLLFQLRSIAQLPALGGGTAGAETARDRRVGRRERALWAGGIVIAAVAAAAVMFLWTERQREGGGGPGGQSATRFTLFPADGTSFYSGYDAPFALSPDGRSIVYVGVSANGTRQLWLRGWDVEAAQPIAGTEGANMPFWSPNSQWIGFFANNALQKVRVSGGLPQTIATGASTFAGATWGSDDVILFPTGPVSGLYRVSAQGGPISQVTAVGPTAGEGGHLWPRFLSDGDHFIYAGVSGRGKPGGIYVASLSGQAPRIVMPFQSATVSSIEYVAGYVLFVDAGDGLFARAFDEELLEMSGEPVRMVDGIPVTGPGRAPFSASATGVLAYWRYAVGTPAVLQWFERNGRQSTAIDTPAKYLNFRLSPDGRNLVFSRAENDGRADLWVHNVERGTESRLTTHGSVFAAVWSPDAARIVYAAARGKPPDLFMRDLRSVASEDPVVLMTEHPEFPLSWSAGSWLVTVSIDPVNRTDLWRVRLQDGAPATADRLPFNTRFNEGQGRISPDGRWIAYSTNQSGRSEVWVAEFPSGDNGRQVSVAGGVAPEWDAAGAEVFYVALDKQLMATPFKSGEPGTPRPLFRVENLVDLDDDPIFPSYTVYTTSDGRRFLMALRVTDPNTPPIDVVLNWPALIKR